MARKEFMGEKFGVFTLNETIVGKGGKNRRSDVQLIQFFLRQFFIPRPELSAKLPKNRFDTREITIDGKFGPQTGAGIFEFQSDIKRRGQPIKVDGIVNIATRNFSLITDTQYTILFLNLFFRSAGDEPELLGNLENHPDIIAFAPELRAELLTSQVGDEF